jgi:hypothetical protein
MEQVGSLVPVNPHTSKIISQKIIQRIAREERQAVRNPVSLIRVVVVVTLSSLAELTNCLGPLLVGSRPNSQTDTVQSVRGILLENKGMVNAVRLAAACANLNIMGETSLVATS